MRAFSILMTLILASGAVAGTALVDANGSACMVSVGALTPTTGCTVVEVDATPVHRDDPLYDRFGRCRWRVQAGALAKLATPRWPAPLSERLAAARRLIARIDDMNARIILVEKWQAQHQAVRDRSAELTELTADRDALVAVLEGP